MSESTERDGEQLMDELNKAFLAGLEKGDAEQIISLYAEDGVYLPAGHPPLKGIKAIGDYFRNSLAQRRKQEPTRLKLLPGQTIAAGDLVLQWGTYQVFRGPVDEPELIATGSQILMARKKPDGSLELLWDIDNIDSARR